MAVARLEVNDDRTEFGKLPGRPSTDECLLRLHDMPGGLFGLANQDHRTREPLMDRPRTSAEVWRLMAQHRRQNLLRAVPVAQFDQRIPLLPSNAPLIEPAQALHIVVDAGRDGGLGSANGSQAAVVLTLAGERSPALDLYVRSCGRTRVVEADAIEPLQALTVTAEAQVNGARLCLGRKGDTVMIPDQLGGGRSLLVPAHRLFM